eukprot:TRINITY_DN7555_c0_g3_i1.p2 TRINITY_DN7555_c0_g3~~TRINITY_DN7555_c0_g3_i1.p2  ORF type:complete len:193 (-),score=26.55 TRINITY_DN7555_c0_g3_i1:179-757(-)
MLEIITIVSIIVTYGFFQIFLKMNTVITLQQYNLPTQKLSNKTSLLICSNNRKNLPRVCRQQKLISNSFGKDAVESWMDITQFVAQPSGSGSVFETLSARIGDRVYADLNGWHIYLKDLKINDNASMADMLANSIGTSPKDSLKEQDVDTLLKKVPVRLGAGKSTVALYDVVPAFALGDLYKICEDFVDDRL